MHQVTGRSNRLVPRVDGYNGCWSYDGSLYPIFMQQPTGETVADIGCERTALLEVVVMIEPDPTLAGAEISESAGAGDA
jgi:hypothetical protein